MLHYLFQVIINFPDPAQKSDIVQLRGPRTEVEKCAKFMQKIVAEMVNNILHVISLWDCIVKHFAYVLMLVWLSIIFKQNLISGGEQLFCLSPHLQAVSQKHNWERWIEYQEGTVYLKENWCFWMRAVGVWVDLLFSRFERKPTQRLTCLLRTATRRWLSSLERRQIVSLHEFASWPFKRSWLVYAPFLFIFLLKLGRYESVSHTCPFIYLFYFFIV